MIHVALADKDRLVAQLLGHLIDEAPDMRVTRIYTNGPSLLVGLEAGGIDVAVVDPIGLTPLGMEIVRRLRGADPGVRIVVVTASRSEQDLFSAVRAGVRGYISKSADPMEVVTAIRAAHQGVAVLSQERAVQLMDEFARQSYVETGLSPRQHDILVGLVQGKTNREIGEHLHLAEKTIKNYMRGLFSALGCRDRTEAAILSIQRGLVAPGPDLPTAAERAEHTAVHARAS